MQRISARRDSMSGASAPERIRRLGRAGLATAVIGATVFAVEVFVLPTPVADAAPLCATPPTSGNPTASGVVNTYYPATSSITAGTANTTVTLGTPRGSAALAAGDLVLVMQMQGAAIDSTNTDAYGNGTAGGTASGILSNATYSAGLYEYARVASVSGSTIGLTGSGTSDGLVNSYVNAAASATVGQQRFQLIRVPQYFGVTFDATTPPTALAWDGTSGGVLAIDAAQTVTLNGSNVNLDGLGFRGGSQRSRGGAAGFADTDMRTPTASALNGQKGEGIAGTPRWRPGDADTVGNGYPNGDFGRGAPGTAGGGGTDGNPSANDQNTGGGGGANGGAGGGGGNSWNSNEARGGYGGAAVVSSAARVVLGGGGGAGSDNNGVGSSAGGNGGGIALIRASSLAGTGTITARGTGGGVSGQDGGGGGGAGGSIVVLTSTTGTTGIAGLTMSANGGAGGNTTYGSNNADRHGPGGGGGGGRIITSGTGGTRSTGGGAGGTHTPTADDYGATSGSNGSSATNATLSQVPGANTGSQCIDVSVTKTLLTSPLVPGSPVSYSVVVTNNGPFPATGTAAISVVDAFPAGLSSISWTCTASTGSSCAAATGTGDVNATVNLERGDSATFAISATLAATFTGTLSNTATVAGPTGTGAPVETNAADNSATASAVAAPQADLAITKTDGAATAVPGTDVTYTVVVSNAGPSTATDAIVTDALPVGAASGTWSCTAGACGATSGSMPMSTTVTLDPTQTATYSVTVTTSPTATGSLANTATVAAPAGTSDPTPGTNLATDTDTLTPQADLSIAKTDGVTTRVAGQPNPYTITVSNAGPSTVTGATVTDTFPVDYTGVSWTCSAPAGSSCPSSGSGDISALVTVAAGASVTFTVSGTVAPTAAAGTLSNTASVALPGGITDPTAANNTSTDTTTITRSADLSIAKTDGSATEVPGTSVTYTIVASNAGPSTSTNATVTDTLPGTLTGASWSCLATAGSTCPASGTGDISASVTLAPGGTATFTLTANIAPGATGNLANTATIAAPAATPDPDPADNTATDTDTLTPQADLQITKTDGAVSDVPGTSITYTITATNAGPSTVTNAIVDDSLPATLVSPSWTCAGANGGTCPAGGSGSSINANVTLPPGGTATFTVNATIAPTATGILTNTASITAPGGVTDTTPGNDTAIDDTTLSPTADLAITKTDGATIEVPGTPVTYTIVASNTSGPSAMTGVTVADVFPATVTGVTWNCVGAGGGTCQANGSGDITATVTLPVGATVTFTAGGTVAADATGSLANTATVTAAAGTIDPNGGNNTATDSDTLTPEADVSITKTDGVESTVPGSTLTYTITAANAGPSAAPGTTVTDTFPTALTGVTWTCSATGGGSCPAGGSGNINAGVDLPVGATVTFLASGTVAPGAAGTLANTAAASVGGTVTDPNTANNTATDTDTLTPSADLLITKTDGATNAVPGTPITYTIVVTNTGPSTVVGATVTDTLPGALTGATWTCTASAGSSCSAANGSGNIDETITLSPSGTVTFTVDAIISGSATGTLANTATIAAPGGFTDPTPGNNSATDTDALLPVADLSITKDDGVATEIPGTAAVYTVVVTNDGPSDVVGATVSDALPPILLGGTWACTASAGSSCPVTGAGDINTTVDLLAGGAATFTITGQISGIASGNLVNTATVTAPGSVTDPNGGNDSATDTDPLVPTADLSITKDDGATEAVPGGTVTYTLVAANAGPSTVTNAAVVDTFPASLTGISWTCVGAGGGTCPAGGSGAMNAAVTLPSGATATFTVTANVSPSATGTLVNTVIITAPGGVTDPIPADNTATDTDTLTPRADLAITKTNGATSLVPGTAVTYTVTASNAGPSAVPGATVTDAFPAELVGATWTCAGAGGGACPAVGASDIGALVDLPVGATVTFTVDATISSTVTGTLVNTATITVPSGSVDPNAANDSATDSDPLVPTADLSITKDDLVTSATPGQSTTYTVVVTNAGPSTATAAPVGDPLPVGATGGSWTCAPAPNCGSPAGSMPLASAVTLAPGASATYTLTVDITPTATGSLANTATVQAPAGMVDPDPADNAASDVDTLTPLADVSISKTDGLTTVVNGQAVAYTVVVSNPGPSTVTGATVDDAVPAQLTGVTWTCVASGGSSCPAGSTGSISAASITLAPGGTATFTVAGTVTATATGVITNTATVTLPGGVTDPTPANNAATDETTVTPEADLQITKTDGVVTAVPGQSLVYTVTATNAGPADAPGSTVSDPLPAGATAMSWTCSGAGGGTCPPAGTGAIGATVDLPAGASVTFTATVAIDASATGVVTNVASVTAPGTVTDTTPGDNTAVDTDTLTPRADLSITKTDGLTSVVPGSSTTYTVVLANAGPSDAPATLVTDPQPAGATFSSWSCAPGVGANCSVASGSGPIATTVDVPAGASVTFTVTAAIDPAATADLENVVTVEAAAGITDPVPGNDQATDTDTLAPVTDLSITKDNGVAAVVPGDTVVYSIVASNAGPSAVTSATVTDTLPTSLTSATWTCTGTAGGVCESANGAGDLDETVDLPVGASVTFIVTGTVSAAATGTIDNTAEIAAPGTVDDPQLGNNSATDTDPFIPRADLSVTKDDGLTTAVPGTTVTYTVTATNAGPSAAPGSTVTDTFPADLADVSWTCAGTLGGTCPASGTGAINATVGLPVGGSVTFTATGTVLPGSSGSLTNTATVSTGGTVTDPDPADNAATDIDTLTPSADLVITKTDGAATEVPGTAVTYTIVVTNAGPSTVTGATVADTLPAALFGATWTCVPSVGSTCPAAGSGDLNEPVTLLPNGTATFTVTATVSPSATGTLANTATVTAPGGVADPTPGNNTATDIDDLTPEIDLQATKTNGVAAVTPGGSTTYTVTVTNAGPSAADGVTVTDALPAGATSMSWTCTATAGSTCPAAGTGAIGATVDIAPAGSVTFTAVVAIAPGASGTLENTVTANAPTGTTELTPADNTATDTDPLVPAGDLSITKTDGATSEVPGTPVTYTITATNAGPSDIIGATVTDTLPVTLTGATWTCVAAGGTCTASGTGDISDTVDLPVGATVTYSLTATVAAAATGSLVNSATITTPVGSSDPVLGNNTDTDTDTLDPQADVSITKTDGAATEIPGTPVTYTIVATNNGPSAVVGALVQDTTPVSLLNPSWACVASVGSTCPAGGSGGINAAVDLAADGTATFTLTADIDPTATVSLANTATVRTGNATDPNPGNNAATDTDTLDPTADLSIAKTDGRSSTQPGDTITYTIDVTNAGPSAVVDAAISDTVPAGLTGVSWTCTLGTGGACDAASGTGNTIVTAADLAPAGSVTYTVTATVAATDGQITNVAQVAAPAGVTDPVSADNAATDLTTVTPTADLSITKTDGLTDVAAGQSLTYTIVVSNSGPSTIVAAHVTDSLPAPLAGASWTCAASAGSLCESPSGTGDLDEIVRVAAGGSITFLVTATIPASAAAGTILNTATVAMPSGTVDPTPANNSATDSTTLRRAADLSVTKTDGATTAVPGATATYTIVATNAGPSDALGATVVDTLPAALSAATWTCVGTAGGTCAGAGTGDVNDTVGLPAGASVTYTVTATVSATATGTLENTATVTPPATVTDPAAGNNGATDTDTLTPQADLTISKTDGAATGVPGTSVTYTVTATNAGPSAVIGATVTDPPPVTLSGVTWTCAAAGGATCAASGASQIADTVDLPIGGTVTYTITGTIDTDATGTLTNTATITPPATVTDPVAGNNSASDTDTLTPQVSISATKTDGATVAVPGTPISYTIVVANAGPSDAFGATVDDLMPLSLTGASWTCAATAGGVCTGSGSGDIADVVDLPAGATLTYTIDAGIDPAANGTLTNRVTVTPPGGVTELTPGDEEAVDVDDLQPSADLAITKDDGLTNARPGDTVTYTVTVTNLGPSAVVGAIVDDAIPVQIGSPTWTCAATPGSGCAANGTGDLLELVDLLPNGTATFTVAGTVIAAATGTVTNVAGVSAPAGVTDPTPANNSATDATAIDPLADLSITKTDGNSTAVAGEGITYTIVVTNDGPSRIDGAPVDDTLPAVLTGATWSCAATAPSSCPAAGTGDIATAVDLAAGGSATFTIQATIAPGFVGLLSNTAAVGVPAPGLDPTPANNSASDETTVAAEADLWVTKTDDATTAVPGTATTYTIVVANAGPSNVIGAAVADTMPAALTGATWTCAGTLGGTCTASGSGDIADAVDLPAGASVTYTVTATISPSAAGTLSNTATVMAPFGVTERTPADNTAEDTTTLAPVADLGITKDDGVAAAVPGSTVTYTIVAANAGPSAVLGAAVTDTFPAAIAAATWTCAGALGGTCTAAGSGNIADTVNLPVGASVTYTVLATIGAAATGTLVNTAAISAPPGATDPSPGNNTATDADALGPQADLSITKTTGAASAVPGADITYTIVASNAGPSATSATVADTFPASLLDATWTCAPAGGAACTASGSGSINRTVVLPPGGSVTYEVSGTVAAGATGSIANTATVSPLGGVVDTNIGDNTDTASSPLTPQADLTIGKTDGVGSARPGDPITYTIVATNEGPSAAPASRVVDTVPAALVGVSWTCTGAGGGSCNPNGLGSFDQLVDLPVGGSVTFVVSATVGASALGTIANTATVEAPATVAETDPADNSATDTTSVTPTADLSISKSDGLTDVAAGASITYTIVVTNGGPSTITGAAVTDTLPAELTGATWVCVATLGGSCGAGSGDVVDTITLPANATATYTVAATVAAGASPGLLSNVATVALPVGSDDPTPGNNTAQDDTTIARVADLAVTKTDGRTNANPGDVLTYTIVVSNAGPSDVVDARVEDSTPAQLAGITWTCIGAGGTCAAAGSGSIDTLVSIADGGSVTFAVTGSVVAAASGTATNTVTVTAPIGSNDPDSADNTATDLTTIDPRADLSITKTDGNTDDVAGTGLTYTIVVSNAGPSRIDDAPVQDTLPAALVGAVWSCVATAGSSCDDVNGIGSLGTTVDLASGGSATFTVTATIAAGFTGPLSNTATVTMPAPGDDPTPANNAATDTTDVGAVADVSVTKDDGRVTAVPGTTTTYTVVVANAGPSRADGVTVDDLLPAGAASMSWTCVATGASTCPAAGSGPITTPVDLGVSGTATFTVAVTIAPDATGQLENRVTATMPITVSDPTPGNNEASDIDVLAPEADLAVVKTDGGPTATPGGTVTYTITVSNAGPSDAIGATVTDIVPGALSLVSWTCTSATGGTCTASGSGSIADVVDLPAGSDVVYTLTGTVAADATGTLLNEATVLVPGGVTDPDPTDNTGSDTDDLAGVADLSITKTDLATTATPGDPVTYTIVVANGGPSNVVGAEVEDVLPALLSGATWNCTPTGLATCTPVGSGDIVDTVDLPAGASLTYSLTATISPSAAGLLVNTATVEAPLGVTDPAGNNSATDTDTLEPEADLTITKDDGLVNARPGDVLTYTIVVTNAGPSTATGAVVRDTIPPQLASATWTCAGAGGGVCGGLNGSGSIVESVTVPVGGAVTFTVTATVTAGSGTIVNTATVEAPSGATDPLPADNADSDSTAIDPIGDVSVVKTDARTSVTPGTLTSYTITVSNGGPSDAIGVTVDDPLPAALTGATWTCAAGPSSTCGASGTGDVIDTPDIAAGESVVYTVAATVSASATGTLSNTVTITPPAGFDTNPGNDSSTDDTELAPVVDLSISKTDGSATAVPGQPVTYTITVHNSGPSAASGARVVDALPAPLSGAAWSCTASAGSACGSGTGDIDDVVNVAVGGTLTYTLTAAVASGATSTLVNTATVTPAIGTTDSNPVDNAATDTDTLTPRADLSITKTDGQASTVPGQPVTYAITVTNGGPSDVADALVADTLPAALTGATWTCGTGTGGGTCDVAAGTGDVTATVDLPAGATVTITLAATVAPSQTADVENTATVGAPAGVTDPNLGNNAATDRNTMTPVADVSITKTDGVSAVVPGQSVSYTVTAANAGPSSVSAATVLDPLPAGAASATWTCVGVAGAACPASGTGGLSATVDLPVGGSVAFTVVVAVAPAATGLLVNTASVSVPPGVVDPDSADNAATDVDDLTPRADLSVSKTDGLTSALPGDTLGYAIVVTNAGPSAVTAAPVTDAVPVELENAAWTCVAAGGACLAANGTGDIATSVNLDVGGSATFTLTADVVSTALGAVANTARIDAPGGVVDPAPGNNAATDTTSVSPLADVSITKTDGLASVVAGTTTSYSIVVTNPGPSVLTGVRVRDTLPAALTGAAWSCTPAGGATCAGAGSGSIDELVDLPAASTVTYVVDATIDPGATGTLSNVATAALPAGAVDPTPANNTATDTTSIVAVTDLAISKTDGLATTTPGTPISYTIVATNAGPSDAVGARVVDALPAALTAAGWTCTAAGAAVCPASGTGGIDTLVDIPVGGTVTFTLSGAIAPTATGQIVNTATIEVPSGATDPVPSDNAATDTDGLVPRADIAVAKTNGTSIVIPGTATTYTIVVSNLGGPSTVAGVAVSDPLPAGATGATWTCSAAAGSSCGAVSGSGALDTTATVAPGADVTYTVTVQTAVAAGQLTNVVTATVPAGVVDPDPTNNSATDVDTLQLTADLAVTKLPSVAQITQGDPFSFTVVVTNKGPNPLLGVAVYDPMPADVTGASWACLPSAGASCAAPNGSGSIATSVGLPVGATATFVISVRAATTVTGSIVNTATVAPPAGAADPDPSNNTATATVPVLIRIPPPDIELSKTTASTGYDRVGQAIVYTLVATNTGGFPLTGVTITDPNATVGACVPAQPATLAPGQTLTCQATRTITQADLDRGSVVNTAAVTAVDPNGATLRSVSQTVTVGATVSPALQIVKSTTSTGYSAVGDVVGYTIVVTNTGNVTLDAVTVTDTIAVVTGCAPQSLAPGASMTCVATRAVTRSDMESGRIDNIASATAQTASGTSVTEIAGVSNLVTVRRVPPTGDGTTPLPLPGTGADVSGMVSIAMTFAGVGVALMAISRRRRPAR